MNPDAGWKDHNSPNPELFEEELPFPSGEGEDFAAPQEDCMSPDAGDDFTPEWYVPIGRREAYQLIGGLSEKIFDIDLEMIAKHYELLQYYDEEDQAYMKWEVIYPTIYNYGLSYPVYRQYVRDCCGCIDPLESDAAAGRRAMICKGFPDPGPEEGAAYWRSLWKGDGDDEEEEEEGEGDARFDPECEYFPCDDETRIDSEETWALVEVMIQDLQMLFAELVRTRYEISTHLSGNAREEAINRLLDGHPDFYAEYEAYREFVRALKADPLQDPDWKGRLLAVSHGQSDPGPQQQWGPLDESDDWWTMLLDYTAREEDSDGLSDPEVPPALLTDRGGKTLPGNPVWSGGGASLEDLEGRIRVLECEVYHLNVFLEARGLLDEYRSYRKARVNEEPR